VVIWATAAGSFRDGGAVIILNGWAAVSVD
jgi:hypothetical protein